MRAQRKTMPLLLAGVLAASLRAAAPARRRPTTRHTAGGIRMPRIAPIRLLPDEVHQAFIDAGVTTSKRRTATCPGANP